MKLSAWLQAFRLRTLPLSLSGVLSGGFIALSHCNFNAQNVVFGLLVLTAVLLQILSNLANDLGDFQNGADNEQRIGPKRAVQSGEISPSQMKLAIFVCGITAFLSGLCMLFYVFNSEDLVGLFSFLLVGLLAIAAAYFYTAGKNPYGYAGLGDLSVFLFFGLVSVLGSFYLICKSIEPSLILVAVGIGALSTAVLNLNNMRDRVNDSATNKITMVVRLGSGRAKKYHSILVLGGLSSLAIYHFLYGSTTTLLVFGLVAAIHIHVLIKVLRTESDEQFNKYLGPTAMLTFVLAIVFSAYLF